MTPPPATPITSTLHSRSLPTVPKAELSYEPLVRNVLRQRMLRNVFPYSALAVWLFQSFWIYLNISSSRKMGLLGMLALPFQPGALLASFLTWTFVVLPILITRRDNLTTTPSTAISPRQQWEATFRKPANRILIAVYIIACLSFFMIQLSVARMWGSIESLHLNVFVKSRKHPFYLNGRFVYTLLSQAFIGFFISTCDIMQDRYTVTWRAPSSQVQTLVAAASVISLAISVSSLIAYTFIFGFVRACVLPVLLNIPILNVPFRPFCAHFIRGRWTLLLPLSPRNMVHMWHTFILGLFLSSVIEFAETLFDENVRKPLAVAAQTADPATTLVSGTTSTSLFYKFFAYQELVDFASADGGNSSAARTALFGDQKHNPSLWQTLVRESLELLGSDYQLLKRRGKPAPPLAPAAVSEKPKQVFPSTPLERRKIFKASAPSPVNAALDALAADGAITQAVEESAERLPSVFQAAHVPLPHVPLPALPPAAAVMPVRAPSGGLRASLSARVPQPVRDAATPVRTWWADERVNKVAQTALPNRELDALVIETLSHFMCASLTEDSYGVVQRDIPNIIELFVNFMTEVEGYKTEVLAKMPPADAPVSSAERSAHARKISEIHRAMDHLAVVDDALKNGIMRVVETFGHRMSAFKFPSAKTKEKINEFASYAQNVGTMIVKDSSVFN